MRQFSTRLQQGIPWQDPNLDILRAVAVLAVLAAHTSLAVTGATLRGHFAFVSDMYALGRFGVLIFFIHTALVLMRSLERMNMTGIGLVGRFYIRRAFRIYPLTISLIVVAVAFSIPPNAPSQYYWYGWKWLSANLLLVQNIVNVPSLSGPLWSLPFEIQMYVVLPLIFLAIRRRSLNRVLVIYAVGLMVSGSCYPLSYVCWFLAGAIAYRLPDLVRPRFPAWLWLPTIAALVALRTLVLPFSVERAAPLVLCVLIPLFKRQRGVIGTVAAQVAKYSYGIYLCHTPLLWLFYARLRIPAWERVAGFVLGICTLPVACYYLIEDPFVRLGKHLANGTQAKQGTDAPQSEVNLIFQTAHDLDVA